MLLGSSNTLRVSAKSFVRPSQRIEPLPKCGRTGTPRSEPIENRILKRIIRQMTSSAAGAVAHLSYPPSQVIEALAQAFQLDLIGGRELAVENTKDGRVS
jgi:hypothetical protein